MNHVGTGRLRSYTSQPASLFGLVQEAIGLYRLHNKDIAARVRYSFNCAQEVEREIRERFSISIENPDMLEIGPGPWLEQMAYFARSNRVTGIDLDVIALGWQPAQYVRMLRQNGARRLLKTAVRKCAGIDRAHRDEQRRQLGLSELPRMAVLQMDACRMAFPPASFDFVYSNSVFQSLPDPGKGANRVADVLRPGGVACIWLQLWTSVNGSRDPRLVNVEGNERALWPHLRPQLSEWVRPNLYLNKLRLAEWHHLFGGAMPGVQFVHNRTEAPGIVEAARRLKDAGELDGYTLDELLTHNLIALWRKPPTGGPSGNPRGHEA